MSKNKIIIMLLFLPVFTAEILTGSTRLWELANPIIVTFLVGLYGFGALIIYEIKNRLHLNYSGVFILGLAYGVIEEGVATKSFFDPNWPDLGIFAEYGRWVGVNWIWAIYLSIFHAVFSITAPIALIEIFNSYITSSKTLISNKTLALVVILFVSNIIALNSIVTDYQPSIFNYIGVLLAVIALIFLSLLFRNKECRWKTVPELYGVYWILWSFTFFLAFYIIPIIVSNSLPSFTAAALLAMTALRLCSVAESTTLHRYWLYTGSIIPLLAIVLLHSLRLDIERLIVLVISFLLLTTIYKCKYRR